MKTTKKTAGKTAVKNRRGRLLQPTSEARNALKRAGFQSKSEFVLKADEDETAGSIRERAAKLGIVLSEAYVYVARANARRAIAKAEAAKPTRKGKRA